MNPNERFSSSNENSFKPQDPQQKSADSSSRLASSSKPSQDAWAKIADELDGVDSGDHSNWKQAENVDKKTDSSFPTVGEFDSSDGIEWDGKYSNPNRNTDADNYSKHPSPEANKIDEDYETRSRSRSRSVWNRGEWSSKERGSESNFANSNIPNRGNRAERFNGPQRSERRFYDEGFSRDKNYSYGDDRANAYRQGGRPGRVNPRAPRNSFDGGVNGIEDGRVPNNSNYRGSFRTNNYRNDNQRNIPNDRSNHFADRRDRRSANSGFQGQYNNGRNDGYRYQGDEFGPNNRRNFRDNGQGNQYPVWARNEGGFIDRRRPRYGRRENLEPTIGALGKRGEPLSLAEELASRRSKRVNIEKFNEQIETNPTDANSNTDAPQHNVSFGDRTPLEIVELEKMTMQELVAEARRQDLESIDGERRHDLLLRVLRARIQKNGMMFGSGTLEILPDEFGFLRSSESNYVSCPDDIYISPSQIRRFGLRNGLVISGQIRPPKERERYFALLRVESINGENPNALATKTHFDDLVVARPTQRIKFEPQNSKPDEKQEICLGQDDQAELQLFDNVSLRALDLVTPFAFGQRALLVYPSRSEKAVFIRRLSKSLLKNYSDVFVFVVLIDKQPEEIADAEKALAGSRCEVVGSTFDETPIRHIQVSELVFEKAKRMVEYGQNVVIVMDSLTGLARAWRSERSNSDVVYSDALDPIVLQRPKKLFSSARRIDGAGALTVIATTQQEDGNQFVQNALNEFRDVANAELWLSPSFADDQVPIPIDIVHSFARDVKDFFAEEEYAQYVELHNQLKKMEQKEATDFLEAKIQSTVNNAELLKSLDQVD